MFGGKTQENLARMIIGEDGMIMHANAEFLSLARLSENDIGKRHTSSVFDFTAHEITLQTIASGLHDIQIHSAAKPLTIQFDWVISRGGKPLLIGTQATPENTTTQTVDSQTRDFMQQFEKRPNVSNNNEKVKTRQRRKTDLIPDLQPFFSLSGDIMIVATNTGDIIQTNRQFSHFFGENSTIKNFGQIFHEDDRPYARGALQALKLALRNKKILPADRPQIIDFEARIVLQSGKIKSTEWRGQKSGGYIYLMGQDLTALKNQREALNRRETQLTQAESIGRMGHWHWTVGEETMEWSEQIYQIFGVERAGFTPTLASMRGMIDRADLGRIDQAFQRAIIEQNDYDMEFSIKQPDGETCFIRCEGRCSLDENGEVIALFGIMQDMTERMIQERSLREAKDLAERSYAAKSQFLANMSHELRTPLNAIIGFSDIMQNQIMGPLGNEKYMEYVSGIKDSGTHLLDLISDILDMSKIEAGKYELDLEELELSKLIDNCMKMVKGRANESGVKLTFTPPDTPDIKIIADRRALMQIILNITSNAVKFTDQGGKVTLSYLTLSPTKIALEVQDTGIGIPANKLATITKPFEQVSSSYAKSHEGSGLGLAITQELTQLHGGTLKITSDIGVGTTVRITLPRNAYQAMQDKSA